MNPYHVAPLVVSLTCLIVSGFLPTITAQNGSGIEADSLGVYWDSGCSEVVDTIDWGSLHPGAAKTVSVFIRNEGKDSVSLLLNTTDWIPIEAAYRLSLDWDYDGEELAPGERIRTTFRLSIPPEIKQASTFSFKIVISVEEINSYKSLGS